MVPFLHQVGPRGRTQLPGFAVLYATESHCWPASGPGPVLPDHRPLLIFLLEQWQSNSQDWSSWSTSEFPASKFVPFHKDALLYSLLQSGNPQKARNYHHQFKKQCKKQPLVL